MKLFYSPTSPFARACRVIVRDAGLMPQISEEIAQTRTVGTPYFDISPIGRIPALVVEGRLIADTRDIAIYVDQITQGNWIGEETPLAQTYRQMAFGFLDGIAVWFRETKRDSALQSSTIIEFEKDRIAHVLPWLDAQSFACRDWNFAGVILACAYEFANFGQLDIDWEGLAPDLTSWIKEQCQRPSMVETAPKS